MKPVRLRPSSVTRAARPFPLAAAAALVIASLGGCGGGAAQVSTEAAPPPAPATAPPATAAQALASGWRYRFDMISPANDNFAVTTREVYLYFKPDTSVVSFQLENRLGVPIEILWDESTFLDVYGRSWKAVHRGATYESRDNPQERTIVRGGERYSDFLVPTDVYSDPSAAAGGRPRNLLPTDLGAQSLIGRIFGPTLVLGMEGGDRQTFDVRFRIASVYNDR